MTAKEIRECQTIDDRDESAGAAWLREIAAQLAELNDRLANGSINAYVRHDADPR